MPNDIRTLRVGAAQLAIINIGDVHEDLNRWFDLTPEQQAKHAALLAQPARLPIQSIYIKLPGMTVLVDAGLYDYPPDSPLLIPGYTPPPGLFAALDEIGVDPATIDHVIITHAHGDHFNALTEERADSLALCFPNARHYVGAADWTMMQEALDNPDSLESRTFGVVDQAGRLTQVAQPLDLGHGVSILPTPGESPGHQAVRLASAGEVLYCIGDLYHLTAEVESPELVVGWTNGALNQQSRNAFNPVAIQENACLIATHIYDVGRLQQTATGYAWERA
jgi:glyoxylase-like metal-dependent hydrolase (beta-lactamase superfamily II)